MIPQYQLDRRSLLQCLTAAGASFLMPQFLQASQKDDFHIVEALPSQFPLLGEGAAPVNVWSYSGLIPGPEIRIKQGEELRVKLVNKLSEPTTIHWHGIRIKNDMDGVPDLTQKPVKPGESFEYRFRPPDAGTFWFHTHNRSWEQMAKGLYGALIVEEKKPQEFARDITLVIDDWRINEEGQIDTASFGSMMDHSHAGRYGNWITVNGLHQPVISLPRAKTTRLRFINTCNSRILKLKLPVMEAHIIAIDGQPIHPKQLHNQELLLGPAQRTDLSVSTDAKIGDQLDLYAAGNPRNKDLKLASFKIERSNNATRDIPYKPITLPQNPLSTELKLDTSIRAELKMEGGAMGRMDKAYYQGEALGIRELVRFGQVWAFNGVVGLTKKPLLRAQKGQTAVIDIKNDTAWPHAMHLHGHHFRVIEKNNLSVGGEPWVDTLLMAQGESASIAFVADNPGKWLFHCHMLEHQASGMTTWISVNS